MKLNFREIYEGWRNHLYPPAVFKEKIAQVSAERLAVCKGCEYNSANAPVHTWLTNVYEHCLECGCPLTVKSKCLSCGCGWKKWEAVITEEEEEEINNSDET